MVSISSYFPQSVILPDKIQRDIQSRWIGRGGELTEWEKREQYDSKTLFFDMFLTDNKKYLVCIGPPLLNLGEPLSISFLDRTLKFSITRVQVMDRIKKLVVIRIKLPFPIQNNRLTLKFSFTHFNLTIPYFKRSAVPIKKTKITLATMQKDYPILWIQDWCRWYRKVHGIKTIIIYDNGSKNFTALKHSLSQLNEDIEILLVHWPFLYGPVRSHENKHSQIGSQNHCHLMFCPRRTGWFTFLDLDEYLYVKDGKPLIGYLKFRVSPIIYLLSYIVHPIEVMDANSYAETRLIRFFDHIERTPELSWNGRKYISRPKALRLHYVHHGVLNFYWRQVERLVVKFDSCFGTGLREQRTIFFYHLKGLNTLWKLKGYRRYFTETGKAYPKRKATPVLDSVLDTRLRDMARDKGLLEESL